MTIDFIIAGLGNPGSEYEDTRHNIGWMVCNALVKKFNGVWKDGRGDWVESTIKIKGKNVLVMLPLTYMNLSGTAINKARNLLHVPTDSIMITVDEYNFPLGKVHVKSGGSDGGHNGTSSVIKELKTEKFWRMRLGIEKNFGMGELVSYVLKPFDSNEIEGRNSMIVRAVESIEYFFHAGPSRACSAINADQELFPTKKEKL